MYRAKKLCTGRYLHRCKQIGKIIMSPWWLLFQIYTYIIMYFNSPSVQHVNIIGLHRKFPLLSPAQNWKCGGRYWIGSVPRRRRRAPLTAYFVWMLAVFPLDFKLSGINKKYLCTYGSVKSGGLHLRGTHNTETINSPLIDLFIKPLKLIVHDAKKWGRFKVGSHIPVPEWCQLGR